MVVEDAVARSNAIIGAVLVPAGAPPKLPSREMIGPLAGRGPRPPVAAAMSEIVVA